MSWWIPVAAAAGGYLIDKQMGGNGLQGAMLGGSLGYGGMGSGASAGGAAGGKGANTAATSLNAGTALGSGGMASAQGLSTLGMGSAATSAANAGYLAAPEIGSAATDPYTSSLLLDSSGAGVQLTAPEVAYGGDLSMMASDNLGATQSFGLENPDLYTGGGYDAAAYDPTLNKTAQPDFRAIPIDANTPVNQGGYEQGLLDGFIDYASEFMPSNESLGTTAIGMGINALTPEQEERLRHQQAMLTQGQTGNVLGQGGTSGIGGQYISRA